MSFPQIKHSYFRLARGPKLWYHLLTLVKMYDQSCQVLPYKSRKALKFELRSEFPENKVFERYCSPRDLFQNCSLLNGVCYSPENSLALRIIYIHNYLPGRKGQEGASIIAATLEQGPRMKVCLLLPTSFPKIMEHETEQFGHLSIVLCQRYPWSW